MSAGLIFDTFSGAPGGWDLAAADLGHRTIGVEWDRDACATRANLGLPTVRADVARPPFDFDTLAGQVFGLIASPPCQSYSKAGKRAGLADPRGQLVWEPLRWAKVLRPRWVACEQVPEVEPIWRAIANELHHLGYSTWVGLMSSEQWGVPQTRTRAILIASLDRKMSAPAPTHQRYVPGVRQGEAPECHPSMFGPGVAPWVSMADALNYGLTERPAPSVMASTNNGGAKMLDGGSSTRAMLAEAQRSGRWVDTRRDQWPDGTTQTRTMDAPAPALTSKAGGQWQMRGGPTANAAVRPATTVTTDRLGNPGHHADRPERRSFTDAVHLTEAQGLILQGFPPELAPHLAGNKSSRWRQIGNAIPPPMARVILTEAIATVAATAPSEEQP